VKRIGLAATVLFVATIFGANWALETYGLVPVGFGLLAPAGVYFAGLAFTLRDVVHRTLGRLPVIAAILAGGAVSWLVSPTFAVASAVAFTVSELSDLTVYEPLRNRNWYGAVVASNIVGAVVDSAVFLWLAFGSLAFIQGQIVGKLWMTAAALPLLVVGRRVLRTA
jgi:uncharacterized PurR-regulated membrane protein YhhQ (DUF165 family)